MSDGSRPIRRRAVPEIPLQLSSLHPMLQRIYAARGVLDASDLDYALAGLEPVGSLEGIDEAVELLLAHRKRSILVVGDFDADGATSTALVLRCLAKQPEDRFANAREVEAALIDLQLELGVRTAWDELRAPAVLEPRRRKLEHGLARLRRAHERARLLRAAVALLALVLLGVGAAFGWWVGARNRAEIIAQREAELAELRGQVRDAAEQRAWVYPPLAEPEAETAYALLLELEALELDDAEVVGRALRDELASELLAYADHYWDQPGGRGFAREFYAHTLVFDPDQPRARARAQVSPIALLQLRERAVSGAFEPGELSALAPLIALAEPDQRQRLDALVELYADADALPSSVAASLDQLIDELERQVPGPTPPSPVEEPAVAGPVVTAPEHAPEPDPTPDPDPVDDSSAARARAAALAERGDKAFRAGERDEAERLYQRAIELDRRCLAALTGLHRIHFDRGGFKDALRYAERALAVRPNRGELALDVGDSCMKVLDYACARRHYERAAELGVARATQRLALLAERLGDDPQPAPSP